MKIFKIFILLLSVTIVSCEDIIVLDLPTEDPRLVIDASIQWEQGTDGSKQIIKLSTTTNFYNANPQAASGAIVNVKNINTMEEFEFIEKNNDGNYYCETFIPRHDNKYQLTVIYDNQTYIAEENLIKGNTIDKIEQKYDGGFLKEDIEISVFFTDELNTENYYMFRYFPDYAAIPTFKTTSDEFFEGNQFYSIFSSEYLNIGSSIEISFYGISKQYYNYMELLASVTSSGGPFGSTPATVRGNIINKTNFDDFAYGYFSVTEVQKTKYIIQ